MSNKEMVKYKEGFIFKIKNFFKRIFGKSEEQYNNEAKSIELNNENNEQNKFFDDLKIDADDVNVVIEKKEFFKKIEGNEEALRMLSIDRLKKLEKYYDSIIEQNNEKIRKLKKSSV